MGFVYLIRDPRDIVISLSHHTGSSIDETINALLYDTKKISSARKANELISTWRNNLNSWLTFNNVSNLIIRYEDILKNPKEKILEITTFLQNIMNIDFDLTDHDLKKILNETSFENLQKLEKLNGFGEATKHTNFFREGKSQQWKKILSKDQVKKIEKELFKPMQKIGYI